MAAFAQLKSVDDPRDRLDRATRHELIKFSAQNGVSEINPEMPAILMRQILRRKGITNIQIPLRVLGQPRRSDAIVAQASDANIQTTDAAADLERQWAKQAVKPEAPKRKNEITELRRECKRLGIKISRTDKMPVLKAKIAEHGQNTP